MLRPDDLADLDMTPTHHTTGAPDMRDASDGSRQRFGPSSWAWRYGDDQPQEHTDWWAGFAAEMATGRNPADSGGAGS